MDATQESKPVPIKVAEKPKGWWSFDGKGTREAVKTAISKSGISDEWVITLRQQIDKLDAKFNHVSINAHCHIVDRPPIISFHINIIPLEMLT